MPNPEKLKVLIVNAESEVIDQFTETEQGASRNRVIFAGARYSTELMETIRHGETDKVEFKEFIRLDDKRDKKVNDIVKSVAAFSNTTGGTILVGIADDAEVLGINDQFPHDRKKAETFVGDYFQKVRELLKDRLNRIPFVDMHAELFGDKTVLVIRVEEGSAKPYLDIQTKDVLIRRGASNVRADENDLRLIFGRGELQDSMGWNQNGSISW
jgi:predicted HTH transcriptional regulator